MKVSKMLNPHCVLTAILFFAACSPVNELRGIASVIDADTIEIHGERIRLQGIDAPETSQLCYKDHKPWPCGQRASLALSDKIKDKTLVCTNEGRGRYKRILSTCFVGEENINAWLVMHEYAIAYIRYSKDYIQEEDRARKEHRGIWSSQFIKPWEWRKGKRIK